MNKRIDILYSRFLLLRWFLVGSTVFLTSILLYLQIYQATLFATYSKKNFLRERILASRRGAITDRNGVLLATDRPITALYWQGTGLKKLSTEQLAIVNFLRKYSANPLPTDKELGVTERYKKKLLLIDELTFEILAQILEQCGNHKNLLLETRTIRYYPEESCACHIIGSFRQTAQAPTSQALMGIEKIFEEQLRGQPGKEELIVDSLGRCIQQKTLFQALNGTQVKTTISIIPQKNAEKLLEKFRAGTIIVMDPDQGDLIVLASHPTFDPNLFTQPISPKQWQAYLSEKPFINRALGSCYPPASLFKLVTAAAALEERIITPHSEWTCTGATKFGNAVFHCNKRYGHGKISLTQSIAQSCNIPFYEIGKEIPIDLLAKYAESFGFGRPTGIILPERTGLVPTARWKEQIVGQRWQRGETVLVSIGQSYSLVTPLQTVRFVGSLGTGRLVRPRILLQEDAEFAPLPITQETRDCILGGMRQSVETGTARLLKKLPHVEIFGKTGTAQVCSRKKRADDENEETYKNHGWFVGYIKPEDSRPFVLMVFLEHVGSARVAVQTARDFLQLWQKTNFAF
ncbi:MAG: Penicillin-binding protein 2 [candidate division TM6 bacterium GW2011_GWF2_43_17]|nr:MAG: Penicillin-binding protein 2 [candidate division TM6 bacterium GW2011_GWF2_43_17]HAU30495.1 hypothetical protein [Candidatus Dependentiae bacterium]